MEKVIVKEDGKKLKLKKSERSVALVLSETEYEKKIEVIDDTVILEMKKGSVVEYYSEIEDKCFACYIKRKLKKAKSLDDFYYLFAICEKEALED